jgi:DNA ligase D-like protein (predicted 3'-phosphoesterase)
MKKTDSLDIYNSKRDFEVTPEPSGNTKKHKKNLFVIQRHEATALHYDFRIESEGVLKSWAVPKGPSPDPKIKRLAIPTEDHPMDYADFEGTIPEGYYGGGTVMVWDTGSFKNITKRDGKSISLKKAINEGRFSLWFDGEKVKGGYTFINSQQSQGKSERWYLVKMNDEEAKPGYDLQENHKNSVLSGRTMEEIKKAGNRLF